MPDMRHARLPKRSGVEATDRQVGPATIQPAKGAPSFSNRGGSRSRRTGSPEILLQYGCTSARTVTDFTSSLQLIREGKLRALGVTTKMRAAAAPDIAPIAELGVPGFEASAWQMVVVSATTPNPIVDRLHAELKSIMAMPEMRQAITGIGLVPTDTGPPRSCRHSSGPISSVGATSSNDPAPRWNDREIHQQ